MYEDAEMRQFYSYNLMSAKVMVTGRGKEKPVIQENACKSLYINTPAVGAMQQVNASGILTILCIMICIGAILGLASMSFGVGAQTGNKLNTGNNITTASPLKEQQSDVGSFRPAAAGDGTSNATTLQLTFQETDLHSLGGAGSGRFIIESVRVLTLPNGSQSIYVFELPVYQPST
jgi:hypothetical protein